MSSCLLRPGEDATGGDENGRDDFACEERKQPIVRAPALDIAFELQQKLSR